MIGAHRLTDRHGGVVVERLAVRVRARLPLTERGRAIEGRTDTDLAHAGGQLEPLRKRKKITIGQRPLHAKAIERRPTNAPAGRPRIAFNQKRDEIHRRIARWLHTVGAQIHPLECVGLIEVPLCVDDRARRVPVAGAQRHRTTNRRVGHTPRSGRTRIDANHDAPQLCSCTRHDSDFHIGGSGHVVGRVRQQRFSLWPPHIAQSPHKRVASRFECTAIKNTANAQRKVACGDLHRRVHLDTAYPQRRYPHRLPFRNLERDVDDARAQRAHHRINFDVGKAASPVQRFDSLHVTRKLGGIETTTLTDDWKASERRWQRHNSRGKRRGLILGVPGKAERTHFPITAFTRQILRRCQLGKKRQHADQQCRYSRAESPVGVAWGPGQSHG